MKDAEKANSPNTSKYPLKSKLILLIMVAMVPLLYIIVYLISAMLNYSNTYDEIISNMTVANSYNQNFKEEMDESLYKLVVSYVTFDTSDEDSTLKNPYQLIEDMRSDFTDLLQIATDRDSRAWLQSLLRNIDTLKDRVDEIETNLDEGGKYEENLAMLDNDIYILTELIQDNIQSYIYYQTQNIGILNQQLNEQLKSFLLFCIVIVVIIGFSVIIAAMLISNSIIRPIRKLCDLTGQIAQGDFQVRASVGSNDEVAVLAGSVNDMTENLEVMVNKIKEDEGKMRRAELRLLQEQINPHFLYNTLDTIVWLIESNMSDKAVNMVVSLSDFFRLVLSRGKEDITIREEELHIRSYLEIQQARYHDILEYEIRIDPAIYDYKILKLTLQPLVENSLYHGIKYKRAKGKIWILGHKQEDNIYLTVKDNGVGMEPEALEKLRLEISRPCKETESGFGLANVNERIQMTFGKEYGMRIHSVKGEGTRIEIVIPANRMNRAKSGEGNE